MKGSLTLLLLGALATMTSAQAPRTYLVRSASVMDARAQKMITHVIRERESSAVLSFEAEFFKIRAGGPLNGEALVQALNHAGVGTFELIVDRQNGSSEQFPVKLDTGDPIQDAINYSVAKSAWVVAHPEAYDAMISDPPPAVRDDAMPKPE